MFINEYGSKNDPILLLLAPMMVSGEDLYQLMHPNFKANYHFIAPDQGGHGKDGADFKRQFTADSYRQFFLDAGYPDVKVTLADGRIPCAVAVMKKAEKTSQYKED